MMYCILYDTSKGIKVNSMYMMCKNALQLGGIHVHQLFKILTKDNLNTHIRAELAILNLMKKPQKYSYVLLICWPLMKWVNPQKRFLLRFTLSFEKSGIVIYIWVVC